MAAIARAPGRHDLLFNGIRQNGHPRRHHNRLYADATPGRPTPRTARLLGFGALAIAIAGWSLINATRVVQSRAAHDDRS
ncbi:hypothetical protein V7968_21170 [Nocardia vulneris]|uniref:hypothetical protein n=1 Tax=Nocardia vulneris TaxID=1141657 RepID=UPI0030CFA457